MKLSAILGRLDEIETKINEPEKDHVTRVHISRETEHTHQVMSDVSNMLEGVRDQGKCLN